MLAQIYSAALAVAAPAPQTLAAVAPDTVEQIVPPDAELPVPPPAQPPLAAADKAPVTANPDASGQPDPNAIVVTGNIGRIDPLRAINAGSFAAVQTLDRTVVGPAARAYQHVVPGPVRNGLHNFLSNLHEPVVFVNFLLQLKPGKAAATAARFAINSTVGVGGLVDVAAHRPFRLKHRDNGFADTLGFYGVKPGPFLFLPVIGPTTVRDIFGFAVDRMAAPISIGHFVAPLRQPAVSYSEAAVTTLDRRVAADGQVTEIGKSADPYATARTLYLARRQTEIDGLRHPSRPVRPVTPPPVPPSSPPASACPALIRC